MKKAFLITAIMLVLVVSFSFMNLVYASVIQDIADSDNPKVKYPVRDNALVIVLQPVPDNSGDYTMTICNKQSHCRQTSMLSDEIRYIGLFLEDINPAITAELKKTLAKDQWAERQEVFRQMYADYMNMYDNLFGELKAVKPPEIKYEVTN